MSQAGGPNWEVVIGLEIHTQLATESKIFSGASTAYGAEPNTQACLVDLGYPGVLPVLNKEVVRMAAMFGPGGERECCRALCFCPQELLLPGFAQGLPDQPVRAADCRWWRNADQRRRG